MDQTQQNKLYIDEFSKDLINTIFLNAINNRVSDIHFEPQPENLAIRFRIDGLLRPAYKVDKTQQEELLSRLKVLSAMNITEHRLPQDGYLECSYQDRTYNIRVSTLPTIYGEAIVCRFHNREDVLMNLKDLGFDNDQLNIILSLITGHSGIILTTGPTGSGKTSLLYSFLHSINKTDKNVLTVEDPIEYHLPNIRQTQINESIGLTFAKVMRSIVRQDPDIVMIGEIRDAETAQMAAQASLIGTLIFSTFHTFDIPALITRLQEMGIANSVIAQALKGVVSTRLLRKICPSCKIQYQLTPEEKKRLGLDENTLNTYKGKGCAACQNLGYLGRIGVYEITNFDDEIKDCIIEQKPASYMTNLINKKQTKKLRASAMEKVQQGISTIDEVIRVFGFPIVPAQKTL
jgi:type IV pilus assembly protein PilB